MKISIAQIKPVKGDIPANIETHKRFINLAVSNQVDAIFFPELSVTGYEPELAAHLSAHQNDQKLDDFQILSDEKNITIGVGFPTKGNSGILISMLIFQPHKPREVYSKQHLHPGEEQFFVNGNHQVFIENASHKIAPAICYELSVKQHSEFAHKNKTDLYVASVLNSVNGVDKDLNLLSQIAKTYKMTTFMSNFVGQSGGYQCAGKSSIWNADGELIAQLDTQSEGILIYDTATREIATITINGN